MDINQTSINVVDYDLHVIDVVLTDMHDREFNDAQVEKLVQMFENFATLVSLIRVRQVEKAGERANT